MPTDEPQNYFTSKMLYDKLHENRVLLMDCRSRNDFQESHLKYNFLINVPEEIISAGKSADRIRNELDCDDDIVMWGHRRTKDHVVLIDWKTETENPIRDTPLFLLKRILSEVCYFKVILIH